MYSIVYTRAARKQILLLPKVYVKKIISQIEALANNPFPNGCKKLSGSNNYYRIRSANYRILYELINDRLIISIIKVAHRKDAYRD